MSNTKHRWAKTLAHFMTSRPWLALAIGAALTLVSLYLASKLTLKTDWKGLLPEGHKVVDLYEDISDRFGNPSGLVVALEGDYDRMTELARKLEPRLKQSPRLRNVIGEVPMDFFRRHGFMLLEPDQFERSLRSFKASDLVGVFKGMNDDYEGEYTDSESNLRRDEVKVARSLLGMKHALDALQANVEGRSDAPPVKEAVDALMLGESWMLSLDRRMLMIMCDPTANIADVDALVATSEEMETLLDEFRPQYPDLRADLTGVVKIQQDEMDSISGFTQLLSIIALLLIYLLLARSFHSWLLPLAGLIPLGIGIIWTNAFLYLIYGSLNLFTVMMMLVLIGLGIDFSIHMISRFIEEIGDDTPLETILERMYGGTGVGVITGALTTSAAFLTLLVGKTQGVHEFGAAAGSGVLLTLAAIFLALPPLLILIYRKKMAHVRHSLTLANAGYSPFLGKVAALSWRRNWIFLIITAAIMIGSFLGMEHIQYEYDWLNLEPKGLRSVDLQREIPKRFGMADHPSWVVAYSVEECRELKDRYLKLPMVADVESISDYLPPADRVMEYSPLLATFRVDLTRREDPGWRAEDQEALLTEINRLWDNLDLMSNLAYLAGLDRVTRVIDLITGTQTETGAVDTAAALPLLVRTLKTPLDSTRMSAVEAAWFARTQENLHDLANPAPVSLKELPETVRTNFLPQTGDGYLVHIFPRTYMWQKDLLDQFLAQVATVSANTTGMEHLTTVMMDETLADGKRGSLLALIVIVLLVLIHFRGLTGLLTLIPLAAGTMAMLGLMYITGAKYNYMNLITVPIILGIGIDDGIHALHRFRSKAHPGVKHLHVTFSAVGRAILLTSLTTMIGFGSLALYSMEGMASFGRTLFFGVGLCFVATVLVMPAALRLVFGRKGKEE